MCSSDLEAEPLAGPIKTLLAGFFCNDNAIVPEVVIDELLTANNSEGTDTVTLVTEVCHELSPLRNFVVSDVPEPNLAVFIIPVVIIEASKLGISLDTNDLNTGVPLLPFGAANILLADCDPNVAVNVPDVLTDELLTVNIDGNDNPTLVTEFCQVPSPLK